jgi:hypothetical protein
MVNPHDEKHNLGGSNWQLEASRILWVPIRKLVSHRAKETQNFSFSSSTYQ